MKIQPDGKPAGLTKTSSPGPAQQPARDGKPVKSFGDLMREKARPKAPVSLEPPANAPVNPLPMAREAGTPPVEMAAPESSPVRQVPPAIQALCTELADRVEQAGPNEVKIEFRSTVLDGLSVTALRNGNSFEIQLEAATPATAALLAGNSPALAERLERLGYTARISIRKPAGAAPDREGGGGGEEPGQGGGGQERHP